MLDELKEEMQSLIKKWEGKPRAKFMSKEYIERRTDRIRYMKLRNKLNSMKAAGMKVDLVEEAKKIFEI